MPSKTKAKKAAPKKAAKGRATLKGAKPAARKKGAPAKAAKKPVPKKPAARQAQKPAARQAHAAQKPAAKTAPLPQPAKETPKPRCLVLAGFGLNAEAELAYAFSLAGADARIVHFSDISSGRAHLSDFEIFAIPGGWSFADEISSGRVLGNKLKSAFKREFEEFVKSGKPILGVCNGFQVLVKLGALPNISGGFSQESTLSGNASGRFEDRWVHLLPQKSACKYFEGVGFIHCPVRHGEGQFVARDAALLSQIEKLGLVPVKYVDSQLKESGYPANPNGAQRNIAGVCDPTGRILGLMPHIECAVLPWQFPRFTAGISHEKAGLRFFENIVKEGAKYV